MDAGEHVDVDLVTLQQAGGRDHRVEGPRAALVEAVGVVELAWPVDAEPDQVVVLAKELAPLVVELGAVGLHRPLDPLAVGQALGDELGRPRKKSTPISVGSPPCQATVTGLARLGFDQLLEIADQHLVGHPELGAGVELLLGQVEAVRAVEVADRPGRLGQDVKGLG